MRFKQLGRTDITVSTLAMGCWAIVGDACWGRQEKADSIAAIHASIDLGITLFDTAEAYGDGYSEELLGATFKGMRDRVVIATKVGPDNLAPDDLILSCENSLRRLKTDYIDLYQVHWPNHDLPMAETMAALLKLQAQGKIRAIGVSNFGPKDLEEMLGHGHVESNQLAYNLLFRAVEFEITPICEAENVGILCYSPLMQALLTGKFATPDDVPDGRTRSRHFRADRPMSRHGEAGCEALTFRTIDAIGKIARRLKLPMGDVALAWLLHQPTVASVLAGARNADQVKRNVAAVSVDLDADTLAELNAATEELKEQLGANADLWQGDSRIS